MQWSAEQAVDFKKAHYSLTEHAPGVLPAIRRAEKLHLSYRHIPVEPKGVAPRKWEATLNFLFQSTMCQPSTIASLGQTSEQLPQLMQVSGSMR